jgi:hypothetical protein
MYASSNLFGSSLTLNTPPLGCGRNRKGAIILAGVFCHRGRSAASVSYSVSFNGVVVEKAHAEVRTRDAFDDCAGRSEDEAVENRQRRGRLEAIAALRMGE